MQPQGQPATNLEPSQSINRPRRTFAATIGIALVSLMSGARPSSASQSAPGPVALANSDGEAGVRALLGTFKRAWREFDHDTIVQALADQELMSVFDLGADDQAVTFRSKDDLVSFIVSLFDRMRRSGAKSRVIDLEEPDVFATDSMAVGTELCRVETTYPDGRRENTSFRMTTAMRRDVNGWRIFHWHVSQA